MEDECGCSDSLSGLSTPVEEIRFDLSNLRHPQRTNAFLYRDRSTDGQRLTNCHVMYLKACSMFKVTPSTYFLEHLSNLDVSMMNRNVGDMGIKAIATAMVVSAWLKMSYLVFKRLLAGVLRHFDTFGHGFHGQFVTKT